ncbi:MAG TPA: serine/threonine-protein kinase [Gemmatimonadales bacterium]|nr:serine/threonine-protein kinase [Gemmatimonadales bacterium]
MKFCPNDGQTLRSAAPATDLVGQVVADRYHVIKKLGEGGMGQVYLAEHVKMGRRSAIKVMNPSMVHDPDAVARFNREASNASRITHPNVCAIYDFGETPDGVIYLAMEFIEGEPLTDLLERDGALPVRRAVGIFVQVADALQAAHDLGIVHRDLKPDNIMLAQKKGGDLVKVVDFGIAKAVGGDESGQKVTKTGLVVGTPEFMSPEQLSGDKLDGRSDLYSLALVFYRMLAGKLPFEANTVQETMIKRLTDEPAKLAATRPDLIFPPGLQAVLDSALMRNPLERYQTVSKFAEDVTSVTGIGRTTKGGVPPTRADIADTEGKTQLLDTSAGGGLTQRISATRAAPPSPPSPKKRSMVPIAVGVVAVLAAGGAWVALSGGQKNNAVSPDTAAIRPDTQNADSSRRLGTGTPTRGNPQTPANRETGTRGGSQTPRGGGPVVNAARAAEALDSLNEIVDARPQFARDSAMVLYNAATVTATDKAMAAFVIANTWWKQGDRPQGCQWITRAKTLDPATPTYTTIAQGQCQ